MDAFDRLRSSRELSENDRAIAGYVLDHPEETSRISSRELARRTYTSATAVLRFCKRLGFDNYNEFKVNIVSDLKRADLGDTSITEGDNAVSICNKMAALTEHVISETKRIVSPEALQEIASLLGEVSYVDIVARDLNATVAGTATHLFAREGKLATVLSEMDKIVYCSLSMPAGHVVFLISRTGTDTTLVEAAKNLRERGIATVAMVANASSPLATTCDYVLEVFYYNEFERFGDIIFATAVTYLFDVLCAMLYSADSTEIGQLNRIYDQIYFSRLDRGHELGASTGPYPVNPV
ncbi:MAG: MurR/RpiR family transcriptional regulator [Atopobiaceae bacterium]|jgi:DNA-binding MurR/RpiR family transcriptional regulator|nr:MurR/RpiR family transcriptional regulator [Atopobiaceae bacterium]MCI2172647.1 MurR/RpiR family transcriptional regulator [Atopobiaceae bacterium]MCI2206954.1 MurR/RpiR family transcriptional regulator [Atopobiaceae bacterium]